MAGARRRPAERAIIYGGALAGLTREKINGLLGEVGARDVPESSYRSVRDHYLPYFKRQLVPRLAEAIESPPTWSDLKKAGEVGAASAIVPDLGLIDEGE